MLNILNKLDFIKNHEINLKFKKINETIERGIRKRKQNIAVKYFTQFRPLLRPFLEFKWMIYNNMQLAYKKTL